jgi:hypothetical protein
VRRDTTRWLTLSSVQGAAGIVEVIRALQRLGDCGGRAVRPD